MAELADAYASGAYGRPCGFESHLVHHVSQFELSVIEGSFFAQTKKYIVKYTVKYLVNYNYDILCLESDIMNYGKENESKEFKKSTSLIKEGIISLVAMLNKCGEGCLYFGVDDSGELVGQEIGKDTLRDIAHRITESVYPQIIPKISIIDDNGKTGILVTVEGGNTPYSYQDKYYIRIADTDRILKPEELKEYFSFKYNLESIVKTASRSRILSFNQLKSLFLIRGLTLNDETFLENLNLLTKDGGYNLLAELISDANDISIKVAKFSGKDKSELIVRNEFGNKCLFLASEQVLQYCEALNETKVELTGRIQRKETKLFDFDALREAWLNAMVHNRWARNVPPAIYIYSDRIEIVSTGGLPSNINLVEFYSGKSYPVNPELQKIFGQLDIVEQTGHGVPLIVSKYGKDAFTISDNFITVTIPFNYEGADTFVYDAAALNATQVKIIALLKKDSTLTINQLANKLNLSEPAIKKNLKFLKEYNMIVREGSDKKGMWRVISKKT